MAAEYTTIDGKRYQRHSVKCRRNGSNRDHPPGFIFVEHRESPKGKLGDGIDIGWLPVEEGK